MNQRQKNKQSVKRIKASKSVFLPDCHGSLDKPTRKLYSAINRQVVRGERVVQWVGDAPFTNLPISKKSE